jgi:hypothetical protein
LPDPAPVPEQDLLAQAEAARRDGNALAAHDLAQGAIEAGRPEPRFRYLQVLASAQMGDTQRAERLYDAYRLGERSDDEDALALRGRLHKDRALAASGAARARRFQAASAAYRRAHAVRLGYFPAINAATTAWAAGDREAARALAQTVLAHADLNPPRDFFAAASRAEALVLLGRGGEALDSIEDALAGGGVGYGERASACRQLEWLCATTELSPDERAALLARLRPPPVITYTGHMFRPGGGAEADLARRIALAIDELGATIAYGALACGADILIAEAILARGGELQVVLPFGAPDFVRASVSPGGEAWVARFHACLAAASAVTFATRMEDIGDDSLFSYGARLAGGLARLRAGQMATRAVQLAVWDGRDARGGAGAAVDVAAWRDLGFETRIVEPGPIDRSMLWPAAKAGAADSRRVTRAIIFTDYKGYSKLSESAIPVFNREVMGRIAAVLARHAAAVCARNTWGDAFHGVIEDTVAAAEITLDIIDSLKGVAIARPSPANAEAAEQEGMRIGLHFGPVYQEIDPVTGLDNFYGSEVTLAARIEPQVIPGQIFTTQPFAAMLAVTAPGRFATRYLGKMPLAKGYGALPIYQLERRAGSAR